MATYSGSGASISVNGELVLQATRWELKVETQRHRPSKRDRKRSRNMRFEVVNLTSRRLVALIRVPNELLS